MWPMGAHALGALWCIMVQLIKPQQRHRFKLRWVAGAYQMVPLALLLA
jgi:hypothetical protein